MIELKVHCDCGQKYKFDVEPANGQMPFSVACPVCKRDGTAKANQLLQQMSVFKLVEPPRSAPAAIEPLASPLPAAAAPARVRLSVSVPAGSPVTTAAAPPPIAPTSRPSPTTIGGIPRGGQTDTTAGPDKQPSFAMGLLGAVLGASVGAVIYFAIYKITGPFFLLRYVLALGVGGLAGWLANLLGKGEGSKELGGLAAVFTIVGILAAQYFLTLDKWHAREEINSVKQAIADGGYAESVKQAKEVVKAIPGGSDAEIRMYLAKQQAEEGQPPKLETVSNDEVKQFRYNELTNYFELASGKLTKEAFWTKNGFDPKAAKKLLDTEDSTVSGLAVVLAVFKAGIISMIAGAGLAFKLSANA